MLLNKALRIMMGSSENDKTLSVAAVWRECNVPPVRASAPASKARALMKYGHLKTWIGILCTVQHLAKDVRSGHGWREL